MTETPPPTLRALFLAFLQVGVSGFGGGLVWVHRIIVERRGWMTGQELADQISLAQLMPGPNIATLAVCVGARLRGTAGALAALAGFMLVPVLGGFVVALLLLDRVDTPLLQHVLIGVGATAAGLMIGTGIRMLRAHHARADAWIVAALSFGLIAFARLPLLTVLVTVAPIGIALAAWRRAP